MTDDAVRRAALAAEERRMRQLRLLVDTSTAVLRIRPLTRPEAEAVVDALRRQVLALFPDKEATFDLIYTPRFRRLIAERFAPTPPQAPAGDNGNRCSVPSVNRA